MKKLSPGSEVLYLYGRRKAEQRGKLLVDF